MSHPACRSHMESTAGCQEPAPSRTPESLCFPTTPPHGNPIPANTCSLYIFLLYFLWRGNRRGLAHPPSPWPLRNKGMQLEGQEFLEQYGWGEKVITCLGFHCGNGCTFPWESLVSGGTARGERGRREQRGRERAGSSMGRKEKGKGIFFFLVYSRRGAEMNYLSPKQGCSGNNRLNTPQTRILWPQEPGWIWGK